MRRAEPAVSPDLSLIPLWSGWLEREGIAIDAALDRILPPASLAPKRLHRALRYAVFPGGKRVRPAMAVLGYRSAGGRGKVAADLGAAIELIHTFSLIHDDLPCMDDDDFRRGRLSTHRKFGEAIAVLAGDALQVLAFEVMSTLPVSAELRLDVLHEITAAVGTFGVIGGQVDDLESEGKKISEALLRRMHARKTAALLRASLVSGAILNGVEAAHRAELARFGDEFGLLFQVVDDILNEVGSYAALGRRRGGDRAKGKATYPSILGAAKSRDRLRGLVQSSRRSIPARRRGVVTPDLYEGLVQTVVGRLPVDWSGPALA
ncbi:MAG: polyprenyl synthetase family protein [Candidatus Eisenbacteria bacterium]|nr:polyprenyl synthetase family protein [Candidatus Eisenbacteria bacterium]MCC7141796.1 polyprenyl synthetase family protein [Candidatus Eisenbacteria bacterium]